MREKTNVHDENTGLVKLLHDLFGWDTNSADKQFCLFFNDYIDQFIEFTLGVVVVRLSGVGPKRGDEQIDTEC